MSRYHNYMTQLGVNLPDDSVIVRVLQSLPPSYKGFMMNYNMQGMDKTIPELFAMLKAAEVEIKKEHQVLMVNKTTSFKKKGKGRKVNFKKNGKQGDDSHREWFQGRCDCRRHATSTSTFGISFRPQ